MKRMRAISFLFVLFSASSACLAAEPGLLFYLSGERQTTADFAANGDPQPTIVRGVQAIQNGAKGSALQCEDTQVLAYWAPGNIYAQRGTLSFYWRSRYPAGPTEFPVFRVAFADHSSWDMTWLRIDYNGHGFDAFVTDSSLARTRVSATVAPFPKQNEWTHLALSWDETRGIRFYINGKLAGEKQGVADFNVALDQFGPHSRIISPYQVQSDYNFVRGGDIDEVRIYDRMLSDENVAALAGGEPPMTLPMLAARSLRDTVASKEWAARFGWEPNGPVPPALESESTVVRKVEIHDAYDLKRWWWKANDGIRETTWPGVFNHSRLPGRTDYFILPDWDCYSVSGKSITFTMPDEPWNHLEIAGAAWGKMELLALSAANDGPAESTLFERSKEHDKTIHRLAKAVVGRKIRFSNVEMEEPIGELVAYNVAPGREPQGSTTLTYQIRAAADADPSLEPITRFINGRHLPDERQTLFATPLVAAAGAAPSTSPAQPATTASAMPLVHILIPNTWDSIRDGLDGIAVDLPALPTRPTHGELLPLNIQIKDPLWLMRNAVDFTFSVKPGQARTIWLDLRDRILPERKGMYITIAAAGQDFAPAMLEGTKLRLVFKPREAARPEHELDRFTQLRDSYAMLVEERPRLARLNLWNRFEADLSELMRVNPTHSPGQNYAAVYNMAPRPAYTHPQPPAGVPVWAFRQVELLKRVKGFVNWYIDNRQIPNGEFGGGLSDDTDLTNTWPGVALMGANPEKITASLRREMEACFALGLFTNGLPTIQTDELHSYEEGINCLAQIMILDYGNPRDLERAMETARGIEKISGINPAGHRHIRSSYYSGTKMAEEEPWGAAKPYSYLVLQPAQLLVDYNGLPATKQLMLELADGMLAHRRADQAGRFTIPASIKFSTDEPGNLGRGYFPWHLYWAPFKWTGEQKYLAPLTDGGNTTLSSINANVLDLLNLRADSAGRGAAGGRGGGHANWQISGDKQNLERLYAQQIEECEAMNYINTEGSLWIDRVNVPHSDLQRARLGGIALARNALFPGHAVSWKFRAPDDEQKLAILIPNATRSSFKVIAYNLSDAPLSATMTGWDIDPGLWEITQGVDANNDDTPDQLPPPRTVPFERSGSIELSFPPKASTVLTLKLKTPGVPYWKRPDLGIGREDISIAARAVHVKVHSVGSVPAPASIATLVDKSGKVIASTPIPALTAPLDLLPKTADITLAIPDGADVVGGSIVIQPPAGTDEITRLNNRAAL